MSDLESFQSFDEFWPYYLSEHQNSTSRALHYLGTCLSITCLASICYYQAWSWLPLILVVGYGPAWVGHFIIEKNRPATFRHPLWSLRGDFKMLGLAITGRLQKELLSLTKE